ncbi:four-jointed box protein 1-like [Physella acuta]|uniref:four-jointed box protein 1-like n=1 Tax=Physella acuta TaxID=109671 RepID=UPI0027DADAE1|nr:four-jointed box protein 1-like [Physella acuta]XP_059175529.1 four-jointed box protein 1-like [Physella acuta]XP_059175530.1 four-jointed box protein 1-like [Physella acuta]XP_059175531.1 four-jointed box protein 1-like [Physella acuta]
MAPRMRFCHLCMPRRRRFFSLSGILLALLCLVLTLRSHLDQPDQAYHRYQRLGPLREVRSHAAPVVHGAGRELDTPHGHNIRSESTPTDHVMPGTRVVIKEDTHLSLGSDFHHGRYEVPDKSRGSPRSTETPGADAGTSKFLTDEPLIQSIDIDGFSISGIGHVVEGMFWSEEVEKLIPAGVSESQADEWLIKSRKLPVKHIEPAEWDKCGRQNNAFAILDDGTEMCVRYRSPRHKLLLGEALSYWLARYLHMDCVPPVSISQVNSSQWSNQTSHFRELGWSRDELVALIMWIDEIDNQNLIRSQVRMPPLLLHAYKTHAPLDSHTLVTHLKNLTHRPTAEGVSSNLVGALIALAQWGSMIILDYITGNYDRVASMQDGAEKEKKWTIIEEPIRNLRRSKYEQIKLWLIDNESGLLDGYELMYHGSSNGRRFYEFHEAMLKTMCIFQRRTVSGLYRLYKHRSPYKLLENFAVRGDSAVSKLKKDSSYKLFERVFAKRVKSVLGWIRECETRLNGVPLV